jgi:choline dehydrogenase-like flavoprotein
MSDTILGNKALDRFDALIIGSGPAGSAVASVLCLNGLKVLILEAGPNYYEGLDDPRPDRPLIRCSGSVRAATARARPAASDSASEPMR